MKVLVVSGASSQTRVEGEPLECSAVDGGTLEDIRDRYPDQVAPAVECFAGREHETVKQAVEHLGTLADVDWHILTDGFGLVDASTDIVATDCSLSDTDQLRERARSFGLTPEDMTITETRQAVAEELGVLSDLEERVEEVDLVVFVVSTQYVEAIEPALREVPTGTTAVVIAAESVSGSLGDCYWLPATDRERLLIGSNWASLRGDLFSRLASGLDEASLESVANNPGEAYFRSLGLA